jgi:hypothetical protein
LTVFADSSALVKLYVPEPGYEAMEAAREPFVISHLARVEVPAAFWRKHRIGELSGDDAALLSAAFEYDVLGDDETDPRFTVLAVDEDVLTTAFRLLPAHGLRACDAVQLASALTAQGAAPACDTLAAFDGDLRRAAIAEGLVVLPPD